MSLVKRLSRECPSLLRAKTGTSEGLDQRQVARPCAESIAGERPVPAAPGQPSAHAPLPRLAVKTLSSRCLMIDGRNLDHQDHRRVGQLQLVQGAAPACAVRHALLDCGGGAPALELLEILYQGFAGERCGRRFGDALPLG